MTLRGRTTKKPALKPSLPVFSALAHGYQKRGVKFLLTHGAAALLLDPGMGKTAIVLKAFTALLKAKTATKMLVIAPLRVCQLVWPAEPLEWEEFKGLRVNVLHGKGKEQRLEEDADIYVINPEGLQWLLQPDARGVVDKRRWKAMGFDTLVIDELTKFKSTKGRRFKMLKQVLPTFSRRWGLTGTPAPNGLLDLFGQMYVLDLGNALGQYITHYRMKFFRGLDPQGWKWVLQPGAAEQIYERIKPLAMRANAEDHLELPELVPLKIMVDLPDKVRDLYESLEDDFLAKVGTKEIVAANAAAASTKCRQVCNGAVYIDDDIASRVEGKKRGVLELHDAKIEALKDLHEELNGAQLLVAYEFNHDESRLRKAFPKAVFMCDANTMAKAKKVEAAWNAGEIDMLFGHPSSMGHGLNFQKSNAQHIVWFGMTWDLELYDQFIKRVRRQGNKALRVFVHHIMAAKTIDEVIYIVQRSKARTQSALLDALEYTKRKVRK